MIATANPSRGRGHSSGVEAVAHLPYGEHMPRLRGVRLELATQLGDVRIHGAGDDERAVSPHLAQQLAACGDRAVAPDEREQEIKSLRRERARCAALRDGA